MTLHCWHKSLPMQYSAIFDAVKIENFCNKIKNFQNFDIFHIFAVLTSAHNLCFGGKIRKGDIPRHTQFYNVKGGV